VNIEELAKGRTAQHEIMREKKGSGWQEDKRKPIERWKLMPEDCPKCRQVSDPASLDPA